MTAEPTSVSVFWMSEVNAVGDELVERLDVVREPADQHAGAVALVEAEREPLEVAEEVVAQVGEHPLARPAGEVGLRVGADERQHGDTDERDDDPVEPAMFPLATSSTAAPTRSGGASEAAVAPSSATIASAVRSWYGRASR